MRPSSGVIRSPNVSRVLLDRNLHCQRTGPELQIPHYDAALGDSQYQPSDMTTPSALRYCCGRTHRLVLSYSISLGASVW